MPPTDRRNLRLVLEYDGRRFEGWQGGGSGRTVARAVAEVLEALFGERVVLVPAAPTDPGVHAEAQVANLLTRSTLPLRRIDAELQRRLPSDIATVEVAEAPPDFHSRHAALGVTWRYQVCRRRSALLRGRSWLVTEALDLELLRGVTSLLDGQIDLGAFADRRLAKGRSPRAEIRLASWAGVDPLLTFRLDAERVSCRTVRRLAGSLVAVATRRLPRSAFERRLREGRLEKGAEAFLAPPPGLFLERVAYAPEALELPLEGGAVGPTARRALEALREEASGRADSARAAPRRSGRQPPARWRAGGPGVTGARGRGTRHTGSHPC